MHPEAWKLCNEAAQEYERVGSPHTFSHREYSKRMNIGRMLGQFARSRKDWWGIPTPITRKTLGDDMRASEAWRINRDDAFCRKIVDMINQGASVEDVTRAVGVSTLRMRVILKVCECGVRPKDQPTLPLRYWLRFSNWQGEWATVDYITASNMVHFQNVVHGASGAVRRRLLGEYQDYKIIDVRTGPTRAVCGEDASLERLAIVPAH